MEAANLSKLSCGALLVDLSRAVSSITRHLVFLVPDSMDDLFRRLCESGYPDAAATDRLLVLDAVRRLQTLAGSHW